MNAIRNLLLLLGLFLAPISLLSQSFFSETPVNDSIVQLAAEARGLELVSPTDLPLHGTYWEVLPGRGGGLLVPAPCPPENVSAPIYRITGNIFLADATAGQNISTNALLADAAAVASLIEQVQTPKLQRQMMTLDGGPLPPGAGGGGGATNTYTFNGISFDTNQLWVSVAGVGNGQVQASLHNATNFVYAVKSAESLLTPLAGWRIETEVFPADTNGQPFTVATLGRPALFLRAEDFSGVDSDADGVPDWWAWLYWATTTVPAGTDFYNGNTFAEDYADNIAPTVFQFTGIEVTNHYVSSSSVPVQLDVAGYPYYAAVQVDDTNTAAAVWNPYVSSNLTVNLGLTEGWHDVWVGLRGHGDDPMLGVWQWQRIRLDTTPPALVITSPAGGTVSTPVIQLAGYGSEPLSSLTYDVSNAAGSFTRQTGVLTGQYYDTGPQAGTTNYFQCYDVSLAEGLNSVTIHATDLAGNSTAITNQYTLDYAGDHVAPALSLVWPADGAYMDGGSFTLSAQVDDATASVLASIVDGSGHTNTVKGLVKRNGQVLVKDLPLAAGDSRVTVVATDAAGNHSTTNLQVTRQDVGLVIHPLAGDQLNQASVTVSGTAAIGYAVTVNGLAATADGTNWSVAGVPVNPVGTASLQAQASDGGQTVSQALNQEQPSLVRVSSFIQDSYFWGSGACGISPNTGHEITIWQAGIGGTNSYLSTGYDPGYDEYYLPPDVPPVTDWEYQSSKRHIRKHYDASECGPDGYVGEEFDTDEVHTFIQLVVGDAGQGGNRQPVRLLLSAWDEDGNPLPVSAITLGGLTPVPTATNADVGELIVSLPAGSTNDVTPTIAGVEHYFFTVQAQDLGLQLAVDNDRAGQITFNTQDQTAPDKPFRFWMNDSKEHDDDETSGGADDQIPGLVFDGFFINAPNYAYSHVQGRSDLVNFFPVALCLSNILQQLPPASGYEYHLSQADNAVKFAYTSLTLTNAFDYLTNTASTGYGVNADEDATSADTLPVTGAGVPLDTNWLARAQAGDGNGLLLVEGRAATTQPLWLEIWRNGQKLAGVPLYLSIDGVEQMFRHLNLSAYGNGTVEVASRASAPNEPPTNGKNLVFLHGYNVNQQQARGVESEMFKRFYWSGSNARFYGVTWNGSVSQGNLIPGISCNLQTNIVNAFLTAPYLATFLNGLSGETTVTAHSLGNMVCLSAISDYHAAPSHYFMIDSAVAMEAVDGNTPFEPAMIPSAWQNYSNRTFASDWWQLFTNTDARSTLTWSNRLGNLGNVDIYNFYSLGEEVLREDIGDPPSGILSGGATQLINYYGAEVPFGTYAWAWQEKGKGNALHDDFISSTHGGWRFPVNQYGDPNPVAPSTANSSSDATLRQTPIFTFGSYYDPINGPHPDFTLTNTATGSAYAQAHRDRILSDAIPALTLPVGANHVDRFEPQSGDDKNFNMQTSFETGWPAARFTSGEKNNNWHHSDFDYVAYPFTYQLFTKIVTLGNLK